MWTKAFRPPHSTFFRTVLIICGFGCDRQKKPGQNWSGVNYQGASTNLLSGNTTPFSGEFGKFARIYGCACDRQKNPAKIGRELINQGASTNPLSWEFSSNPDSCIKFFNRSLEDTQNLNFAVGRGDRISDRAIELASAPALSLGLGITAVCFDWPTV